MPSERSALILPQEVWELVASYLTLKEWAGFSGTCRAMFPIQPKSITSDENPLQVCMFQS